MLEPWLFGLELQFFRLELFKLGLWTLTVRVILVDIAVQGVISTAISI